MVVVSFFQDDVPTSTRPPAGANVDAGSHPNRSTVAWLARGGWWVWGR